MALGVTHQQHVDILDAMAAVLKTVQGPWIIGADFQCTPEDLMRTGWLDVGHHRASSARP